MLPHDARLVATGRVLEHGIAGQIGRTKFLRDRLHRSFRPCHPSAVGQAAPRPGQAWLQPARRGRAVFLCVVDPGVGGTRASILVQSVLASAAGLLMPYHRRLSGS